MNSATYSQLTAFHAIVNEGSIVAAARKLEIAPPSVSKSLKQLEKQIGQPLFHRTTRRIELTDAGRFLWQSTQDSLSRLQSAVEIVQDFVNEASGSLRISVARHAYLSLLRDHLGEFCQRYPNIQLEISLSDGKVDLLKDGFDLGIRFGDRLDDSPVARQLTPPIVQGLFASRDYVARFGTPQSLAELVQHRLIGYRFTTANRLSPLILQADGEQHNIEMPIAFISNSIDVAIDAIRQGIGIGRIFLDNFRQLPDQAEFVPILEPHWLRYPPIYLYYQQHSQKVKRIKVLIDFLVEKCGGN